MEIPEAAIEAVASRHPEWASLLGAVEMRRAVSFCKQKMNEIREEARLTLQAALPALREQWVAEQLEAMRSDEVIRHVAYLAAGAIHNQADHEEIAREIIAYLTSPQLKVSDAQS